MTNSTLCANFETSCDTTNYVSVALIWVKKANAIDRQRNALKHMSDQRLADIGLTRDQALSEASRSFWDI